MRNWLVVAALLILPMVVYWPTVTHEYGFRDDYSNLREVRERPGWLMTLTSSSGRPVYGVLLEGSLSQIYQVTELAKTVNGMSKKVSGIVDHVRAGKGTAGAFIWDDAIYVDMKEMVRDLKRNPWKFLWKE